MARHIGIGAESTYGTAVAPTEFFDLKSESLQREHNDEAIKTLRSWSTTKYLTLNRRWAGDITIQGNYQDLGLLLKSLFGGVDTTGVGPYTHTFPASTGIPATGRVGYSLTTEVQRDSSTLTWRYNGGKVVGLTLTGGKDQVPEITVSLVGKGESTGTAATVSLPTFDPMLPGDLSISFDGTALVAESLSLSVAWPVDDPYVIGSQEYGKEPVDSDALEVTGDVVVLFDDMTEYNKFVNETEIDVQIACDDGTHSLTANLNKCRLVQATPPVNFRDRLMATYSFVSTFDTAATENLQIILVNDDATIP